MDFVGKVMEKFILDAINDIANRRRRPGMQAIYNRIKEADDEITMEDFKDTFDKMEADQRIIKRKDKDSYFENKLIDDNTGENLFNPEQMVSDKYSTSFQLPHVNNNFADINGIDLRDGISNYPSELKVRYIEYFELLKDEINLLKSELQHKNNVINQLLLLNLNRVGHVETIPKPLKNVTIDDSVNDSAILKNNLVNHNGSMDTNFYDPLVHTTTNSSYGNRNHISLIDDNTSIASNNNGDNGIVDKNKSDKTLPKIEIIGDSMLNNINERGLSKNNNVRVRNHRGSTSEDLKDFANPIIKRRPDVLVIHIGSNDLGKDNIDTIQNIQTIVNRTKRRSPNTRIAVSSIIIRKDRASFGKQYIALNNDLKTFADDNLLDFICNDNLDDTCLGVKRVHLNKKGNSFFARNLINYFDSLC